MSYTGAHHPNGIPQVSQSGVVLAMLQISHRHLRAPKQPSSLHHTHR